MKYETEIVLFIIVGSLTFMFLGLFIVIFIMYYQRKKRDYFQEKAAIKAQYEQEILTSQLEVQNVTLQQVGQELHDNIGQLLAVAKLNLHMIEGAELSTDNQAYINQTGEIIDQSITDLRALTKSLDGDFVADFGLCDSVAQELQRIQRTRRFETELNLTGPAYSLGFQREIVLFRIVQEVLTNALKHSGATRLVAGILYEPALFTLTLTDNGKGFDQSLVGQQALGRSGAGLRNMKRRASLIGADCTITSAPGQGTSTQLIVPV